MSPEVVAPTHLLDARDLGRTYSSGVKDVVALEGINLRVSRGSFIVVKGRSGSGKTTLLNLLGGLDQPTHGSVRLNGEEITKMDEPTLADVRRTKVGYIFQAFGLIPILTASENVEVPLRLVRTDPVDRRARSQTLLELVGLGDRVNHRPHELSGGEQQRVAIARALANKPRLLLADEPTGQLDSGTGKTIIELLISVVRSENVAAIVVTHDPVPSAIADRVVELSDGVVVTDSDWIGGKPVTTLESP